MICDATASASGIALAPVGRARLFRFRLRLAGRPALGFTLAAGSRVGVFGGSFNPAHEGHAHVAETALKRLRLDRVLWLVSPQNPLKPTHETGDLATRLASISAPRGR